MRAVAPATSASRRSTGGCSLPHALRLPSGAIWTTFFKRVDLGVVKSTLAELEKLDPSAATDEDFIDLGETTAFTPEVMDGECAT